jgi:hypothetical protein
VFWVVTMGPSRSLTMRPRFMTLSSGGGVVTLHSVMERDSLKPLRPHLGPPDKRFAAQSPVDRTPHIDQDQEV